MDIRKLQRAIVDGLEDVKAQNIRVFNTEHLSPLFERVIVASGASNRQTKALAASVRDAVKSRGLQVLRTEGEDNGEWIIVDCGAAVAHIMQPAIREYYNLEELWGDKPVRLKSDAPATRGLPKAAEPAGSPSRATSPAAGSARAAALAPVRSARGTKDDAAKLAGVAKPRAVRAAPPAKPAGERPSSGRVAASQPTGGARKTVSRVAGKKTAAKSPGSPRRASSTLTVTRKTPARRAPARKATAPTKR